MSPARFYMQGIMQVIGRMAAIRTISDPSLHVYIVDRDAFVPNEGFWQGAKPSIWTYSA
jgi:hypothetical protein